MSKRLFLLLLVAAAVSGVLVASLWTEGFGRRATPQHEGGRENGAVRTHSSPPAAAPAPAPAQLTGSVVDAVTRAPVAGAYIALRASEGGDRVEASCDEQGRFALSPARGDLFLVCRHPGYAARRIALRQGRDRYVVELAPLRAFRVRLTDLQDGVPNGVGGSRLTLEARDRTNTWTFEVGLGEAEVQLPAATVSFRILTPGWVIVKPSLAVALGAAPSPLVIALRRAPLLIVRDRASGEFVPRVSLLCRHAAGGVFDAREVATVDGRLTLLPVTTRVSVETLGAAWQLTVWADGYQAESRHLESLRTDPIVEVELRRGSAGELKGRLRDGGAPLEDVRVACGLVPIGFEAWIAEELRLVRESRTDPGGRFSMNVPPGDYVLLAWTPRGLLAEPFQSPRTDLLELDLRRQAWVEVVVRDGRGGTRAHAGVILREVATGRLWSGKTNGDGRVSFPLVYPGDIVVRDTPDGAGGAETSARSLQARVEPGESVTLTLVSAHQARSVRVRAVVDGMRTVPAGYRYAPTSQGRPVWREVPADGWLPTRARPGEVLDVRAPDDRTRFRITVRRGDGHGVLSIPARGPGYAGRVRDAAGAALERKRIWADAPGAPAVSTTTDSDGRFTLVGLEENRPYTLTFAGAWVMFRPAATPSSALPRLDITLPADEPAETDPRVEGRVLSRRDRAPLRGALVTIDAVRKTPAGEYFIRRPSSFVAVDAEGRYRVRVAPGDYHVAYVARASGGLEHEEVLHLTGNVSTHDILVAPE